MPHVKSEEVIARKLCTYLHTLPTVLHIREYMHLWQVECYDRLTSSSPSLVCASVDVTGESTETLVDGVPARLSGKERKVNKEKEMIENE